MTMQPQSTNRLAGQSSSYLLQHAHNPVNWYPWGDESLQLARELDRPIFLSIGYSACHWCHVMEHESFQDPETARILNEHFVSIKVDREERPDLDQIYMAAVQAMTGQGGWPMSVFLTPDLKPFYGGTYFPPEDRFGRPSFKRLLQSLADAWQSQRDRVQESCARVSQVVEHVLEVQLSPGELTIELLKRAASVLARTFDEIHGGFGAAPKFPHALELRLLLRAWKRFGDDACLRMTRRTLDHMAMGGINDQLGGGFHRYSTDERWLVPHFEKMLYDNALLAITYLEGYQATGDPFYRQVVHSTLAYVLREMTNPLGGFYSSQDADSEGQEGKYYVWTASETEEVLGPELFDLFADAFGVSDAGNWEGQNILSRVRTDAQLARLHGMDQAMVHDFLDQARTRLLNVRGRRQPPARDKKILTCWNGLMIDALAQAAAVLENQAYTAAGVAAADFLLSHARSTEGSLLRCPAVDAPGRQAAFLDDYAYLINGLISLYEATFSPCWIDSALDLADAMIDQFWDIEAGGFFFTSSRSEKLIVRHKDPHDGSVPSGNSMAVTAILRLAQLTGRLDLQEKAEATLRLFRNLMDQVPTAASQMLNALDYFLGPVTEFAIVGAKDDDDTRRVLRCVFKSFRPRKIVGLKAAAGEDTDNESISLLAGKRAQGRVTTYICENFACSAPLVGSETVETALAQ
jgi:uncharacterized protein YyaL (SSP411 family)